jgi:IS5 family transposase
VVGARSLPDNPYDGHTLEQETTLSGVEPKMAIVDRGFKGVSIEGVETYHSGQRKGITRSLRAIIRRRSAIEPTIGQTASSVVTGSKVRSVMRFMLCCAVPDTICG